MLPVRENDDIDHDWIRRTQGLKNRAVQSMSDEPDMKTFWCRGILPARLNDIPEAPGWEEIRTVYDADMPRP
eukprot:5547567-Pyramimonas_sp.AAC.1